MRPLNWLKFTIKFVIFLENMSWVIQLYGDELDDFLINVVKQYKWWMECARKISENKWFTITLLSFVFTHIPHSLLYKIFIKKLLYQKFCAFCLPKLLTEQHKMKWQSSAFAFLTQNSEQGYITGWDVDVARNPKYAKSFETEKQFFSFYLKSPISAGVFSKMLKKIRKHLKHFDHPPITSFGLYKVRMKNLVQCLHTVYLRPNIYFFNKSNCF